MAERKNGLFGPSLHKSAAQKILTEAVKDTLNSSSDKNKLQIAAEAKASLDTIRMNRTLVGWALASCLAMIGCGAMGLYLIDTITSSPPPPKVIDLAITGLVIGAGTKPLHDLIELIESSKTKQEDPLEVQP